MTLIIFHVFDEGTRDPLENVVVKTQYQTETTGLDGNTDPMDFTPPYWILVTFSREGYGPKDMTLRGGGVDETIEVPMIPTYVVVTPEEEEEKAAQEEETSADVVSTPAGALEIPEEPVIPSTGNPLIDPIILALWPIAKGFVGLLQWLGGLFTAPVEAALVSLIDTITASVRPGSPDKKVEDRVIRMTEEYRKRLEEISKKAQGKSIVLDLARGAGDDLLKLLLGAGISMEVASVVGDQIQPMRRIGLPDATRNISGFLGIRELAASAAMMPATIGILEPLRYYYNREFTPLIPSLPDLITMLVREVLTPTEYTEYASWHGESATWAARRYESHWVLPARTWIDDALHRGVITEEEWARFYVWHDYKPEARPGITKSDIEILAPLRKTLIPRVDVRRGWEYGHIGDGDLLKRYEDLGYEEDAPLMAEIQKQAALDGEISMVKGELVNLYQRDLIAEGEFVKALEDLKTLHPRNWYWVVLARLRKARTAKESVEIWAELSPEMEETLAEETI